jgi:phosphatidylserine/phosphatidylglycerophosphate/cardiolipin synthase-like enzyme
MPKFLGVCMLAIAIFCGLVFEGRPSLAPSRATTAPRSIAGPAEVPYAPGEDLESIDVALIGEAVKQIDMAAYVLTDRAVIEALREAAARGVRVRIWRDANMAAKVRDFRNQCVRRRTYDADRILHRGQTAAPEIELAGVLRKVSDKNVC